MTYDFNSSVVPYHQYHRQIFHTSFGLWNIFGKTEISIHTRSTIPSTLNDNGIALLSNLKGRRVDSWRGVVCIFSLDGEITCLFKRVFTYTSLYILPVYIVNKFYRPHIQPKVQYKWPFNGALSLHNEQHYI